MTTNIIDGRNSSLTGKMNLYKNVFGESPWNEGFICGNCGKILPKTFYGKCDCGEVNNFKPFYENKDLKKSFEKLTGREGYKEQIEVILGKEAGFIWGWNTCLEKLNKEKLGLSDEKKLSLRKNILDIFPDFDFDDFYYFAEIGVKKEFRGQDIAGKLYRQNLEQIKSSGAKYILVRTTKKSDVPYKWFLQMGYKEVFSYNDEQDRVILVLKI